MPDDADVSFSDWCRALDAFMVNEKLVFRSSQFTRAALDQAYNANMTPKEFYEGLRNRGLLPQRVAADPMSPREVANFATLKQGGWIYIILGFAIEVFAWNMNVGARADATTVTLDGLAVRQMLFISGIACQSWGVVYFAADAVVRAIKAKQ